MVRKAFWLILLLIFALNLLTWMIWGHENTIEIAAQEFKTAGTCFADTIHVFTGREELPWYISQYSDFTARAHAKFEEGFRFKTFSLNLYEETYQNGRHHLPDFLGYENTVYGFDIIRVIPLIAILDKHALAGDGSASYRSSHLWFFRWWGLNDKFTAGS